MKLRILFVFCVILLSLGVFGQVVSARTVPATRGRITQFAIPTNSSEPWGIALGPDKNLWFTESNTNKIGRITPKGVFTEFIVPTTNSMPFSIVAGPDGNLWFT
jgi:virginiamycin B lyase